jgi:phospholipid transport system transporter-binding protein
MNFIHQNNLATLSGDINFANVVKLRRLGEAAMDKITELSFDFSAVHQCDSSALALLIAWQRYAKKNLKIIHFLQVPASLVAFAKVCNVQDILALSNIYH